MVINRPSVALKLFAVVQGFNLALDRLIPDLAIGLAASCRPRQRGERSGVFRWLDRAAEVTAC